MAIRKLRIGLSFGIVSVLLVWLTLSGFNENMQYYASVSEVKAMGKEVLNKGLRVKGYVVPGSIVRHPNSLEMTFVIEEDGERMEVHYARELPDTFKDGSEVLVEGTYAPAGYFEAETIMAKCPSKYESNHEYDVEGYEAHE